MAGERILVVDDNPLNLKLMLVLLRAEGYDVRTSADAHEARAMLESFEPRLILMDLQLPGTNGLELTRQLKADPRTRAIPIIVVTAYAMKGDADRARDAGCDGYVTKPFETAAFTHLIAEQLARQS